MEQTDHGKSDMVAVTSMMSVMFTGLCAFVPNGSSARVVLGNARDHAHPPMEPHIPAILVDLANWTVTGRAETFSFDGTKGGFGGVNMRAYELDKETISIATSGGLALDWGGLLSPCPTFGMGGDDRSLNWIAKMATVSAGVMSRDAFSGSFRNVLARIDINSGDLGVFGHAFHNQSKNIAKWQQKEVATGNTVGTPQALAEIIQWTFSIGSSIVIASSQGGGDIKLTMNPGGVPVIWIVNQPKDDIITFRGKPRREPDAHFAHFYDLAVPSSGRKLFIPHPLDVAEDCGPIPGGGVSNPRCPVTFFGSVEP